MSPALAGGFSTTVPPGKPFFFACLVSGWVFLGAGVVCLLQFEYDVPGCGVFKICLFALVFILLGVF